MVILNNKFCRIIDQKCKICNRNEDWTSCTKESYFGTNCKDECFICPGGCNINGKCLNDTYCIDDTFYVYDCDEPCSNIDPKWKFLIGIKSVHLV